METFDQIAEASRLWAAYSRSADTLELRARKDQDGDLLAKAATHRRNAHVLWSWLGRRHLVKGRPIPKRLDWHGFKVSVENPAGSVREWWDPFAKKKGLTIMLFDYGYLRGSEGTDGDQVDVFLGPYKDTSAYVYVVRQMKPPHFQGYDEDKCMIGFASEFDAHQAYLAHYDDPRFLGCVDVYGVDEFCEQVKATGKAPGPVGGWISVRVPQLAADVRGLKLSPALIGDSTAGAVTAKVRAVDGDSPLFLLRGLERVYLESGQETAESVVSTVLRAQRAPAVVENAA